MVRWVKDNTAPPSAPPIEVAAPGPPVVIARDAYGNARGGIRLSQHAVPTATNTGANSGPGFCRLFGTFQPFDDATLHGLYADHRTYVTQVVQATLDNLKAGYLVPEDAVASIAEAAESDMAGVATPAFSANGVTDPATWEAGPLATDTIVSIFGTNLATVTAAGERTAAGYPTSLFGTQVSFGFVDAPLLYVSPSQINAVVPANLAAGDVSVTVTVYGSTSRAQTVTIASAGSK